MFKKKNKIKKKFIIIMKNDQIFYIYYFYLKHGLSKKLSFFCYMFMFKYLEMN
jgi:hypothetical protein